MFTTRAMEKWGYSPLSQNYKNISANGNISPVFSGYLHIGDGTDMTVNVLKSFRGASYGFEPKGGTLTVNLPSGEVTTTGQGTVTFTATGSLTKLETEWLYVGK